MLKNTPNTPPTLPEGPKRGHAPPPKEAEPKARNENDLLIRDLVEPVYQVEPTAIVRDVKQSLEGDNPISAIVVVNGNRPVGLVMSIHLDRTLSQQYGVALYHKKPVDQVMDSQPLIVEGNSAVEVVANKAMLREKSKIFDHIIVTDKGVLQGIVSVQVILQTLAGLQASKNLEIAAVNKKLTAAKKKTDSMNRALRNAFDRLQEVDKMKTDFLSMVSHELRTPLTSVLGFGEIAQHKLKDEIIPNLNMEQDIAIKAARTVESNVDIILTESERLTALVNDVLDIAKLEAGKIEWKKRPININDVVERAVSATSALFRNKGLKLETELAQDLPKIHGDQDRLIQVVINLLSNAQKFTQHGSVICRSQLVNGVVEVRIIDTGQGIASEDQPKVFDKFRQVGETLTDKPMGTGLGLPICRQIIQSHDGIIGVESVLGEGSQFWFTIPPDVYGNMEDRVSNLDSLKLRLSEASLAAAGSDAPLKAVVPVGKLGRLLLVDHDPSIRERLCISLEQEGFTVTEAVGEDEAREALTRQIPDMVVMRFMMPTAQEFKLANVIAGNKALAGVPVMMLTVKDTADERFFMSLDRYFPNPVKASAIVSEISAIGRKQGPVRSV
ncbi:MAG: response regulator, partial [Desulfovibrio sp.]